MARLSFDGQSFQIDGRRIWLVSGSIHYPRTPRALWRNRIRAAKQAGLNCICTYVFWNLHERRPGKFDFEAGRDLRRFVEIVGEEGMYCILRPGPYVCAEWDFGGLPPWLNTIEDMALRQSNDAFLQACSRYLGAVMGQVKDLQVTAAGGGPIVMVQAENEWLCSNPEMGTKKRAGYLREIVRYLRETGCTVPINVCNNLWQRVEGAIDTWNAALHLPSDLRQLRVVQPEAPRVVTEYWPGMFDHWGTKHQKPQDEKLLSFRLAGILASGAQYNLYMFHGGTNFGFYGGRSIARPDCFMTTSYDYDAPLREAGGRGENYLAVKRISTFASQFGHVLAHLEPDRHHTAVLPSEDGDAVSVIHQSGSQGSVVFILKGRSAKTKNVELLLPNGLTLSVPMGDDSVAWTVLGLNLGMAELTYTNLRPWAMLGRKMLVLFGPAGADGVVVINDAMLRVTVPRGKTPTVHRHEDITIVILNREQVDAAYLGADVLVVGAAGLDGDDQPIHHPDWPQVIVVDADGELSRRALGKPKRRAMPRLGVWQAADVTDMVTGESDRYRPIDGPASLEALGADYGYGWYRLTLKKQVDGKIMAPQAADRLHFCTQGKPVGLIGLGPGASVEPTPMSLGGQVTVLADNLGRFNFGWQMGERKGLFGHLYTVDQTVGLSEPTVVAGTSPDPFRLGQFILNARLGETRPADTLVWQIKPTGRHDMILDCRGFPQQAMVFINDQPLGLIDAHLAGGGFARLLLRVGAELKTTTNELRLALFDKLDRSISPLRHLTLYQTTANVTANAVWAFAPWTVPAADAFGSLPARAACDLPRWYRTTFNVSHTDLPLWLQPDGMTKGQIYLNGQNVGRYFVQTHAGEAVPPQHRYYLPEPWIKTDGPNELLLFDEHGHGPTGCRLVYDPMGPYGK